MVPFSREFLRKCVISLSTAIAVAASPHAFAQDYKEKPDGANGALNEQRFAIESDLAVSKMDRGMIGNENGDVDQDFVAMMIPHHQSAIDIARAELKYGHDEHLKQLAQTIVREHEHEIEQMRADALTLIGTNRAEPSAVR
jgi:uncharacterized protein (DUF305 family)